MPPGPAQPTWTRFRLCHVFQREAPQGTLQLRMYRTVTRRYSPGNHGEAGTSIPLPYQGLAPRHAPPPQPFSILLLFYQTRNTFLPVYLNLFIYACVRLIFAFPFCGCSLTRLVQRPVPIAMALVAEQRALQPYPCRCTSPDSPRHAWTHLLF